MPGWRTFIPRSNAAFALRLLCAVTLLTLFIGPNAPTAEAIGASFIVTSNADLNDAGHACHAGGGDPACTLRSAIEAANALTPAGCNPNCSITFNLTGLRLIDTASALPMATVPVVIDGGAGTLPLTPGIEILGHFDPNVPGGWDVGVRLQGGLSTLRGLAIHGFQTDVWFSSNANKLAGCWLGINPADTMASNVSVVGLSITADPTLLTPLPASNNVIGGTTPADRNVIAGYAQGTGIQLLGVGQFPPPPATPQFPLTPADSNIISGNWIGVDPATGTLALGNAHGIDIDSGANNQIGGTTAGAGNVIAGTTTVDGSAIRIHDTGPTNPPTATGNLVQGNYIGTNAAGTAAVGSLGTGVSLGAAGNTVSGNVISGNQNMGIVLTGDNNTIQSNLIGTTAAGSAVIGNGSFGIWLTAQGTYGVTGNTIGGAAATGNVITGSYDPANPPPSAAPAGARATAPAVTRTARAAAVAGGVVLGFPATLPPGSSNRILSNRIFGNTGLGIDLGGDGSTPNDPGDSDPGPNALQNFPVLTSAAGGATSTTINGTLNSTANATFTVEFFANAARADANYQGETFLFSQSVTTDGTGNASFAATTPSGVVVAGGQYVTATATDAAGNTSEFSAAVLATGGPTPTSTSTATGATPTSTPTTGGPGGGSPTFIQPVRVVDTRPTDAAARITTTGFVPGAGSACQPLVAGQLPEGRVTRYRLAGCAFGGTSLPADITGVMLNVTSIQNGPSGGFLTVYAADVPDTQRPNASTLNPASAVSANFWTTSVGAAGANQGSIAVYSAGAVRDIAIDIVGYFRPTPAADRSAEARAAAAVGNLRFVTPVRVLDTRPSDAAAGISTTGVNADGSAVQPGKLTAFQPRRYALGGRTFGAGANQVVFPNDVAGVIAHVTTVAPTGLGGFVTLLPGDATGTPGTSTLNPSRPVSFNTTAIGLPADGTFAVFSTEAVDVLVDVVGYYAPSNPATTGSLTLVPPQRVLDTRPSDAPAGIITTGYQSSGQPIVAAKLTDPATVRYLLAGKSFNGQPALPADIKGVLVNVTLVQAAPTGGFVTVYPGDAVTPPTASTLNPSTAVAASFWASGVSVAPAANAGTVAVNSLGAPRDLIIDLVGYFR